MQASTPSVQLERHIPTCAWVPPEPVKAAARAVLTVLTPAPHAQ
jgi:hypothetical protein